METLNTFKSWKIESKNFTFDVTKIFTIAATFEGGNKQCRSKLLNHDQLLCGLVISDREDTEIDLHVTSLSGLF